MMPMFWKLPRTESRAVSSTAMARDGWGFNCGQLASNIYTKRHQAVVTSRGYSSSNHTQIGYCKLARLLRHSINLSARTLNTSSGHPGRWKKDFHLRTCSDTLYDFHLRGISTVPPCVRVVLPGFNLVWPVEDLVPWVLCGRRVVRHDITPSAYLLTDRNTTCSFFPNCSSFTLNPVF